MLNFIAQKLNNCDNNNLSIIRRYTYLFVLFVSNTCCFILFLKIMHSNKNVTMTIVKNKGVFMSIGAFNFHIN